MHSDVRVASPIGQSDGGAATAGLSFACCTVSSAPCGHHVFVHEDMAATAGAGASPELVTQLLLVRGQQVLHMLCAA